MASANDSSTQAGTRDPLANELVVAAHNEPVRTSRSRLEPCAEVISVLRGKRWSFAAITTWLAQHGVQVAESTVQRFYRSRQRNPSGERLTPPSGEQQPTRPSTAPHEIHQTHAPGSSNRSGRRPKYNTDF